MIDGQPKILLFGAGSVGTVYLYLLSKVASATAVCRSNYDVVKENGFIINSSIYGQNIHFTPNVVRDCTQASATDLKPFDYVLVCSKAIPGTIPIIIRPVVTPGHTVIVLIQNGIGIEDEYATAFPNNPIVSCVVYLPATQRPAGIIKHGETERLEIGSFPSSAPSTHSEVFAKLLRDAGATAEVYDDVQIKRWFKLVVNASWNPLCALTLCTDVEFMESSSPATGLAFDIMLEVCDIAKAYGYTISREETEFQLGRAKARIATKKGIEPSMLQDVKEGRRMEVEAIIGNTVRMGKEKRVKCDKLEMLYVLAAALDSRVDKAA
ncbi:2-dehydropantoate 2-reductase [Melanomma pulvis-pyrius CBS 109.77]|uniref:2-dehydropantoate 2-reductase n=1 Tax=Melanomma pulvis-pyrius CBS 109.77 TaxID=1314802 RepID=A0A6A6WV34_9PLEO|nr:2-dehydropantoate 2-reductase [Melanomma pulvis-pyrius CBS 109.77]